VDSSSVVLTDSLGAFSIPLRSDGPFAVRAERLGYLPDRFDLGDEAPSRISVLLLAPSPIELAGITAVDQDALTVLLENIESRRNSFPGRVLAFDRVQLERLGSGGSVWEFVQARSPFLAPCWEDPFQLCTRGRGGTMYDPNPEYRAIVCIDGWTSYAPLSELDLLPIDAVALVEIYGPGHIRVYTPDYLLARVRRGRTHVIPLIMGCG
jgi:hypothetical protein